MGVFLERYNMRYYNKHEILLLDTCFLYLFLYPWWIWQYLVIYHNNVTHISSVVSHYVYSYSGIFFTWPCIQWYFKYVSLEIVHNYYRFKIYNLIFHQTFCFAYIDFYLWRVSKDHSSMLTGENAYSWKICNTDNRTLYFIGQSYFSVGKVKCYVRFNQ